MDDDLAYEPGSYKVPGFTDAVLDRADEESDL